MKKFIKFNIIAIALLASSAAFSQQLPQFTQYMFNTISINPAYAGSRETLSIIGLHRSQWTGIDGGPTTQTLSVHTPLRNEKIGVGVSFIKDKLGFENFNYLYADFSYTIQTSENAKLAFGLKGGFTGYSIDQELRDLYPNDPAIYGIQNRWKPNIGAGVYWHSNRWYVGLSAPRLLNTDHQSEEEYKALETVSYYFTGGLVFDLSENTKLKPSFLIKATNGAPLSYDINANFLFYEKLWLGAGYRFNQNTGSIGGLADFQITKQFRIGYAYEHTISDLSPYVGGTHEVLLMFEVFKSKRNKSPRYF